METENTLAKHPQVVYRPLESKGGVLLHLQSGQYHGVNGTGLAIWDLLDGERSVAQVVAELRARVEDPPADLQDEVVEFLGGLSARGLTVG
jgi:hypothetical protein